jgi:ferredoxin-NADP reductase
MASPQPYTAKLVDKIVHSEKFVQLIFELINPPTMDFQAGQYVSIQVDPNGTRRSYSICSTPGVNHGFELLIDTEPHGVGTTYLNNLKFGDQVNLLGPIGKFIIPTDLVEPELVFIATGCGVTPFRSMVLDLLQEKHDPRPITLLWGLRHPAQLFWQDEFSELQTNFPNFKFHPVMSQPTPEWNLCSGRVTDCLSIHDMSINAGYYLCGNQHMIADVNVILAKIGVQPEQIHLEKFS